MITRRWIIQHILLSIVVLVLALLLFMYIASIPGVPDSRVLVYVVGI